MQRDTSMTGYIWCAVPVFNNEKTVRDVVAGCLPILRHVVVIDDGSTDTDVASLLSDMDVVVLKHEKNLGKGRAILTASQYIEAHGGAYMITIDADGQHYPDDMTIFLPFLHENGTDIIIGCRDFNTDNVPESSRFGRRVANFWLRIETGLEIDDCQSGFRAYPVRYLNRLDFKGSHYDFEAEALAKAAWAGLGLKTVDIRVRYPEPGQRVSSFKPFLDNLRISLAHSMLVGRRLLPISHKRLVKDQKNRSDLAILLHPGRFLKMLLKENATPGGLAAAAAVGTFFAIIPLIFVHTVVILYVATRLNLNRIMAINIQHLFMPPLAPALCIEIGYFMRNGKWLTDISFNTIFSQFASRLTEWLLGSLVVAPAGSLVAGLSVYAISSLFMRQRGRNA
jgi:glycosyltransferase involved in cell wall biosynthesis